MAEREQDLKKVEQEKAADTLANTLLVTFLKSPQVQEDEKTSVVEAVRNGARSVDLVADLLNDCHDERHTRMFAGLDRPHLESIQKDIHAYLADPTDDGPNGNSVYFCVFTDFYLTGKIDALREQEGKLSE